MIVIELNGKCASLHSKMRRKIGDKLRAYGVAIDKLRFLMIFVVVGLAGIYTLAIVWDSILTPALDRSSDNKSVIKKLKKNVTQDQTDIDQLNTTIITNAKAIVSKVKLNSNVANITSNTSIPFDSSEFDPDSLWDNSTKHWTTNKAGFWSLSSCVTWDFTNMPAFPPNGDYELRIDVYVDDVLENVLNSFGSYGVNTSDVQTSVCGQDIYNFTSGTNVSVSAVARTYPSTLIPSDIVGGATVATRGYIQFLGTL